MICTHVAHKRHIMQKMRFLCLLCAHHNVLDVRTYLGVRTILKFCIITTLPPDLKSDGQKLAAVAPCKFCLLIVEFWCNMQYSWHNIHAIFFEQISYKLRKTHLNPNFKFWDVKWSSKSCLKLLWVFWHRLSVKSMFLVQELHQFLFENQIWNKD